MFSVRLSPDGALAVTGGEDDKAFVWKTVDCSILFQCNGTCLYSLSQENAFCVPLDRRLNFNFICHIQFLS